MKLSKANWIVFFAVALLYLIIQFNGLIVVSPGDENVYFYMAKSVAQGQLPYRDFFYAHPPLHVLIMSLIIKVFGFSFTILKSAELLELLVSAFFLYKICIGLFRQKLEEKHADAISFLALIFYLSSFEILFKATFALGTNTSLMFLLMGFYFVLSGKYFTGGAILGAAGLARFYTLPPVFVLLGFTAIKKFQKGGKKDMVYLLAGFLLTFGVVIFLLALFFGHNFIDSVFSYHLLKPKLPNQRSIVYKSVITEDWIIFLAFFSSFFMRNKKKFQMFYFAVFGYLFFLLSLNVPAEFYFSIGFPFMAIIGAYSIFDLTGRIKIKYLKYSFVAIISLIFLWNTIPDVVFLEKFGFLEFAPLKQMAAKVSGTNPNQKLFGDDSSIPMLGLIENRSIALNYIDSNEMRFTSGLTNFYIFKNQLDSVNLSYIIFRKNHGLHQILEFRQYADDRCTPDSSYSDIAEGIFLVYRCY